MDFPFADAASIIRANQKDIFVENELLQRIREVLQSVKGVRFTHNWSSQIYAFSELLYLGLTSFAGSRTLGEEYTDMFYLTSDRKIPSNTRVGLYVITSGLAPLIVPKLTLKLKTLIQKLQKIQKAKNEGSTSEPIDSNDESEDEYLEEDKKSILEEYLTPETLVSLNLTIFYFSGAYYQLSKRIFGLRYAIGHRVDPLSQPSGSYELIGMLMIIRALFKLVVAIKSQYFVKAEVKTDQKSIQDMGISLSDETILPFINSESRRCNLCLESMRAPTVTLCGHMYCWNCISGWCRDQSECPLCRQECQEQHLLCLKG